MLTKTPLPKPLGCKNDKGAALFQAAPSVVFHNYVVEFSPKADGR